MIELIEAQTASGKDCPCCYVEGKFCSALACYNNKHCPAKQGGGPQYTSLDGESITAERGEVNGLAAE